MLAPETIVLYVEDDEGDRFFMERAFKQAGFAAALRIVPDGLAALDYLEGRGPYADRSVHPAPDVILLDLNLPELSGFEVLEWVRKHPVYVSVPVIMFSSSAHPEDPRKAAALGANAFWRKPNSGADYVGVVQGLAAFTGSDASAGVPTPETLATPESPG